MSSSNMHNTFLVPENSLETVHGNKLHISNDNWQKGQLEPEMITYISESRTFTIHTTTHPLYLYHILLRHSDFFC